MVLSSERPMRSPAGRILMRDASRRLYRTVVGEVGDRNLRVTCDAWRLEIMSPPPY